MPLPFRSTVIFLVSLAGVALLAGPVASAQDQIPWAANLEQAQKAAADQHKLLLLHFYGDHCLPCERLEKTVFNQPQVVQAVSRNYIPVKIHAGMQPEVAQRYQVKQWPTDVICTAGGQEIHRTISPPTALQYSMLCDGLATQTGVGAGRQWVSSMQASGQQVADQQWAQSQGAVQGAADQAAAAGQAYLAQANNAVQGYAQQAQQQTAGAAQQWNQGAQQVQGAATNWSRQLTDTSRQVAGAGQQIGNTVEQTARDLHTQWDPTSLRAPSPTGSAGLSIATGMSAGPAASSIYQPTAQGETAAATPAQPSLPTRNPWIGQSSVYQPGPQVGQPADQEPAPGPSPVASQQSVWQPSGTAAAAASADSFGQQAPLEQRFSMVPADRAPPIALEGYCPVTLLEQQKWQRGDTNFGAIHQGRTYLFHSAAEQARFLANPDRFSLVFSGFDPVILAQRGEKVEGKRSYGITYQKRIFLFASEQSLQAFRASPQAYAEAAHQAMLRVETAPKYR